MKVRVTFTMDQEVAARLDRMAESIKTNRSALIDRFVRDAVEDQEPVIAYLASAEALKAWRKTWGAKFPEASYFASIGPAVSNEDRRLMRALLMQTAAGKSIEKGHGNEH